MGAAILRVEAGDPPKGDSRELRKVSSKSSTTDEAIRAIKDVLDRCVLCLLSELVFDERQEPNGR